MPIIQEIVHRRRDWHGRDSSRNILAQAVWAQREETTTRLIIARIGRENGMIVGIHGQMGVRRIMRQLRKLVPQFELVTGQPVIVAAAVIRGTVRDKNVLTREVIEELRPILAPLGLRTLW